MSKVAVVTDTTAYIPQELCDGLPIYTAPLQIIWGQETFRDVVDIQPAAFYDRLQNAKVMPTTSQPSPAVFIDIYQKLLDQGYDIVSAHISSKLSGTLDSAIQARQHFPGARIELVDSLTTSMCLGFPVLIAARAALQGATMEECKALIETGTANSGVLFAVATLEFLHRGGRIGGASAFLGTAFNLKPILELREGRIEAVERVRTMNKATDRLVDLFVERVGHHRPARIAVLHGNVPDTAQMLMDRVLQRFPKSDVTEAVLTEVSAVVGAHTGPGVLGLAFSSQA
jgi:DegV family protein with EDD domain